jgi:hypothetical protein
MAAKTLDLPEPRGYLDVAFRFGVLTPVPFALMWSFLTSRALHWPFMQVLPFGITAGVLFGICFGLVMGVMFKDEVVPVDIADERDFLSELGAAISEIGYKPADHSDVIFGYKPTLRAGLAAGRISVVLHEGQAIFVGPTYYVKKLLRSLRYA